MYGSASNGELGALLCGILIGLFLRLGKPWRRRRRSGSAQPYRLKTRRPKRVA
jgi:hypothetical protein